MLNRPDSISRFCVTVAVCLTASCAPPLDTYVPRVDLSTTTQARFESDLSECRAVAHEAALSYFRQVEDRAWLGALSGAASGAIAGAAIGTTDAVRDGALIGAAIGPLVANYDALMPTVGERGILDQCMNDRGYRRLPG